MRPTAVGPLILSATIGLAACAGGGPSSAPAGADDGAKAIAAKALACERDAEKRDRIGYRDHKAEVDRHVLVVTSEGYAKRNGEDEDKEIADPVGRGRVVFRERYTAIVGALEAWLKAHPDGERKVLIYVNGGLNTEDAVLDQAAQQIPCMRDDGYFPIFLAWKTGPIETYAEQIFWVRNGELKKDFPATWPLYLFADIGQGLARAPVTFYNTGRLFNESAVLIDDDEYTHKQDVKDRMANKDAFENVIFDEAADNRVRLDVGKVASYGITWPGRILTTPFLDSMGKTAWENMVRRSRMTVNAASDFQKEFFAADDVGIDNDRRCYPHGTGAFSKFFQELERNLVKPPKQRAERDAGCAAHAPDGKLAHFENVGLTVIGHSMGTMVLNQVIPNYRRLPYRNIVYLAPASSIRDFDRSVTWVIRLANRDKDPKNFDHGLRFYNLMLHPWIEARERTAEGLLPTGSLLEWIDDIYEGPKTMIDRTLGKWRNVRRALHIFPDDVRQWMTFKVFGIPERPEDPAPFCGRADNASDPQRHGEFNNTEKCYWLPDFWGAKKKG